MWIARDKYGSLFLYETKPKKYKEYFDTIRGYKAIQLNDELFPKITFENSPQKIELKLQPTAADRGYKNSIITGLKKLEEDYMLSYAEEIDWLNKIVD